MRHPVLISLCLAGTVALAGCQKAYDARVERAVADVNKIDESNLNEIMLTVADPNEAVDYFRKKVGEKPDEIDYQRDLAKSLVRAGRATEAVPVYKKLAESPKATDADRVDYASVLIRTNDWTAAKAVLDTIPPTYETYDRYRLEAMVADSRKDWKRADSFYEIAAGMTTQPAGVYNNWGYSKLTRGDAAGAERLFIEALTYDKDMFAAKNNLVMARGAQHKYDLPIVQMTQSERAQLLYTMALVAVKQGNVSVARSLLQQAIDTSPQYFEAAQRSLDALDRTASN